MEYKHKVGRRFVKKLKQKNNNIRTKKNNNTRLLIERAEMFDSKLWKEVIWFVY